MHDDATTEHLIRRVEGGDQAAAGELVDRHRERLWRMVSFRLDPRVSARRCVGRSPGRDGRGHPETARVPECASRAVYSWLRRLLAETRASARASSISTEAFHFDRAGLRCTPVGCISHRVGSATGGERHGSQHDHAARRAISTCPAGDWTPAIQSPRGADFAYVEQLTVPEIAAVLDSQRQRSNASYSGSRKTAGAVAPEDSSAES